MHMSKHTHTDVCMQSLSVFLSPSHLPTIFIVLVDKGHFRISGQLHQIQKDIGATPHPYSV